ncbi:MAG: hypothetical protein NVSMB45_09260 [Ginsengibacter sp.]
MKKLLLYLCLGTFLCGEAQKKGNPEAFAKNITEEGLKKNLSIIASAEMEGRETATPGQKRAAAYIQEQFISLGLKPGYNGNYQMPYPVYQDSVLGGSLSVNDKNFNYGSDFRANVASDNNGSYAFSEIVYVGYGRMDSSNNDYRGMDVRGKAIMMLAASGNSRAARMESFAKMNNAVKNGAALILVINPAGLTGAAQMKGNMYLSKFKKTIGAQQFTISENVAKAIMGNDFQNTAGAVSLPSKLYIANISVEFKKQSNNLQSSNVLGVLEGTDKKDEYLFLTAHYDHLGKRDNVIYYGADDDGSGTVSVLEMAKAFTKAAAEGYRTRRSIVFMTVSGEEKGLWGSEYYSEHPVFPIEKTTADLNTDMVGRVGYEYSKNKDSMNYVYVIGDDKLSSELRGIADKNNKNNLIIDRKYNDLKDPNRFYYRSDHFNFARVGIPVIFYFDGEHKDYHQPSDTIDKIYFDLMEKRVRYIFMTAWDIANRDNMIKRDIPLPVLER